MKSLHAVRSVPLGLWRYLLPLALLSPGAQCGAAESRVAAPDATAIYASQPLMFEANEGQSEASVRYLARGPGYTLLLSRDQATLVLGPAGKGHGAPGHSSVLRMTFLGANSAAQLVGRGELRAKINYLLGSDPRQWHRDVPTYAAAEYQALYPGVDARFHGGPADEHRRRLEFDFDVAAGVDPQRIVLQVQGARDLRLDREGNVVLAIAGRDDVVLGKPRVYQLIAGQRREVTGEFVRRSGNRLAFALGRYDHSQRLIIDPTLEYSSYVAEGNAGAVNGVTVGEISGHAYAYIVGTTTGGLAITTGAFQTSCQICSFISSAFVAKYDTSQSGSASLIYSTYFGPAGPAGTMPDELGSATGNAIAVDATGNAYITGAILGSAGSAYLPPPTAATAQYLATMPGSKNAFVAELDPTGETLLASTYLGGNNAGGSGGNAGDQGLAIALDASDNVYVAGLTDSPGLATPGAPQTILNSGLVNDTPFVAKLNAALSSLDYFTYLGGSQIVYSVSDSVGAIAVDSAGEAYIVGGTHAGETGWTGSFPTPVTAGFQPVPGGSGEAGFLAKLNAAGTQLLYLTYLGGSGALGELYGANPQLVGTRLNAIALDGGGNAYVAGSTSENTLPATGSVVGSQSVCSDSAGVITCPGGVVAEFAPTSGSGSLLFLSYLGGLTSFSAGDTEVNGIGLDGNADIYLAGATNTTDMPEPGTVNTPNGSEPSSTLNCVAGVSECESPFLVELAAGATSVLYSGYLAGNGAGESYEIDTVAGLALDSQGNAYLAGREESGDFPTTAGAFSTNPAGSGSYLAMIGGLPSSGGTPSVAAFTLDGAAPTPVPLLGYGFSVSAPATTSLPVPVILTNTGGTAFTLSGMTLFGSGSPPFTLTSLTCNGTTVPLPIATPVSVGAGQSCTILLQFAPTAVFGGYVEGLAILDNASSTNASSPAPGSASGQFFVLTATATAAPPPAYATYLIGATPIVEGNFLVPAVTLSAGIGAVANTTLTLTNTGGENLTVSGLSLSGSTVTPSPWSITSVSCPPNVGPPSTGSPATLEPGQSCSIGLQFAPNTLGVQDVALTVLDTANGSNLVEDAGSNGQEFPLQGTAGQPYASFSLTQLDFGTVTENAPGVNGNGPKDLPVVVTNTGDAPLVITGVTIGDLVNNTIAFSGGPCLDPSRVELPFPITLAPMASCTFTLQFAPNQTLGLQSATAFFIDNASESNITTAEEGLLAYTQELPLSGIGALPASPYPTIPYASFSASVLNFNGTGVQTQTLSVTNIGGQPLTIDSVALAGANAFTLVPEGGCRGQSGMLESFTVTLDTFQYCTFTFQFDPSVTGTTGTFPEQNGGPIAGATFALGSSYSNLGTTDQVQVGLFGPGAMVTCESSSGSDFGIVASQGAWEWNPMKHIWAQTININSTMGNLPQYLNIVLEGLNTSLENYISFVANGTFVEPFTGVGAVPSGYLSTVPPAECGDTLGSPFLLFDTEIVGLPGGGASGYATTEAITLQFAPVSGNPTAPPSYRLKVVNAGSAGIL
jgi:hypothetical protein